MADRFFRDIRDALQERDFHYDTFEECVCDLLAHAFPGIVPIRGGADSGMDGAIPAGDAPPMPVVVTTAEDVIGNLTRNLKRYLRGKGGSRTVVLASSRELTSERRMNLEERAHPTARGGRQASLPERHGCRGLTQNPWTHIL